MSTPDLLDTNALRALVDLPSLQPLFAPAAGTAYVSVNQIQGCEAVYRAVKGASAQPFDAPHLVDAALAVFGNPVDVIKRLRERGALRADFSVGEHEFVITILAVLFNGNEAIDCTIKRREMAGDGKLPVSVRL